jgi:hypothetical protein
MEKKTNRPIGQAKFLGDFVLNPYQFKGVDEAFEAFHSDDFIRLNSWQKEAKINLVLLHLIQSAPQSSFLLIAILEFIERVVKEKVFEVYSFTSFELWLNQHSALSEEENYQVRARIVGKWVPRNEYQRLFPVGMGKIYPGSHFVTAHSSPDLDTTVASFWGWVDAFGARVSEGMHVWNVPDGPPPSSIELDLLFHEIFGKNVFEQLAKTRTSLAVSSLDLMTQQGVIKQRTEESVLEIDHGRTQKAIVLVDELGYFLGDWRNFDVEGVRQVLMLLNNCLRWFENNLHVKLVSLFAKEKLTLKDLPKFTRAIVDIKMKEAEPARDFTERQNAHIESFLRKILKVSKGLSSTFGEFAEAMGHLGVEEFQACIDLIEGLSGSGLFDDKGLLVEKRPQIFHYLEKIIFTLDQAIQNIRFYTERLEVALMIKTQVFGYLPQVVSYRADVNELKSKMGNYPYLTVTTTDDQGRLFPLGVVRSNDLHRPTLGTVTLRDFCNREETKIPSYLEVISVIDHHKSALQTSTVPVAYITDSQSSNALVADLAFAINDRFSTGGMTFQEIEEQTALYKKNAHSLESNRILKRLLQRQSCFKEGGGGYGIDPVREFVEYLHFLYAILDDTDLLTKVTQYDVEVVASLLNRLKSLMLGKEVEILHFDDLKRGDTFVVNAANRILQHPDMYSLYRKIYLAKEKLVEENFRLCAKGEPSSLFVDTKLQNGCTRIGQTKLFSNNYGAFKKSASKIRESWWTQATSYYADHREFDLHMQMVSTIAGAEDLFSGTGGKYRHKDELWLWVPSSEQAIDHLKSFLNAFRASPQVEGNDLEVEFLGSNGKELSQIFKESFVDIPHHFAKEGSLPIAVIRYKAGLMNSRKAMISPYLPKLIS